MGLGVAALEVVRVVGADDPGADRLGDRERLGGDFHLLGEAVGLDLHEVVVPAKDLLVPAGRLPRPQRLAGGEEARDLPVEAAREDQEPVRMRGEELLVHARLVVEPLEVGLRDELDEVPVARAVAREDGEVVGALVAAVLRPALSAAPRGDVELAAENRLDARLLRRLVEVDRAEEVPVVGERERGKVQVLRLLDEPLELGGAVEETVLRMDVEVDEVAMLHAPGSTGSPPTALYSHSIVDGGFDEISKTTRLTPFTSLMMRLEILPSRS